MPLLPASPPRCTINNVTRLGGDNGAVCNVRQAYRGAQGSRTAPALLLRRLQAARIPAGLQGSQEAATKPAPGKQVDKKTVRNDLNAAGAITLQTCANIKKAGNDLNAAGGEYSPPESVKLKFSEAVEPRFNDFRLESSRRRYYQLLPTVEVPPWRNFHRTRHRLVQAAQVAVNLLPLGNSPPNRTNWFYYSLGEPRSPAHQP